MEINSNKLEHSEPANVYIEAYKNGELNYVRVNWNPGYSTQDDFVNSFVATMSIERELAEIFGKPDFRFEVFEYTTENWFLTYNGKTVLVSTAAGRGCSYEIDATEAAAAFGYNAPAWWSDFINSLKLAIGTTESGRQRLGKIRTDIAKVFAKK